MKASFIEPTQPFRVNKEMPVVIYLHGNSSSRMEGMKVASEILHRGINLFIFDFAGCGLSEGEYISLGWYEKDDLKTVVDFVQKLPGVGKVGLWGRSMGAVTALFFAQSDNRISAACYDSPFSDFVKLTKDVIKKYVYIPNFLFETILIFVRRTIQEKNGFDIYKLIPIKCAKEIHIPGFFVHAINDELVSSDHTMEIFNSYAGEKILNICEGNHNTKRPKNIQERIGAFFSKHLLNNQIDE